MRNLRNAAIGAAVGGLLSVGTVSVVTAQADSTPRLDIGTVAQELELSEETQRELAPLLERLNGVFARRQEHFRQGDEIQEEIANTYDQIAETLSAAELREFHWLLRETAVGPRAGRPMGRYMTGNGMWGPDNRGPAMRGGRGNFGRGMPMRGTRGYRDQRMPMRGVRPGWRFDDFDPNS